jgi:hypothetical protein
MKFFPKKKKIKKENENFVSVGKWMNKNDKFSIKGKFFFFFDRAKSNIYIACFNILRGLDGLKNQLFLEFFYGLFLNNKVEK